MRTAGHVAVGRLKSGDSSSAADSKPRLAASREASELGGPLSLVALTEAVRGLQHEARQRDEESKEAHRLHRQSHSELKKKMESLETRIGAIEAKWRTMAGDVEALRSSPVAMKQVAADSKDLGVVRSELKFVKQTLQAAEARAGDHGRMLTDVRSELGALQQRHATLASSAAAEAASDA